MWTGYQIIYPVSNHIIENSINALSTFTTMSADVIISANVYINISTLGALKFWFSATIAKTADLNK